MDHGRRNRVPAASQGGGEDKGKETMMSLAVMALLATPLCGADSLQDRIVSNDPSSYRIFHKAHGGAGALMFQGLLESSALETNFLFLHAGQVLPNSSIGHHFHHTMEEMYVILDGEAEFTINGRTARLKAPVAVPCRMGQSHGIYNPTARSIAWLNFCVSSQKDKSDALDLGDDRVGAALDPKPVFVSVRLDRELLSPIKRFRGGEGTVLYRRALNADVFRTSWAYVDQLMIHLALRRGRKSCRIWKRFITSLAALASSRLTGNR